MNKSEKKNTRNPKATLSQSDALSLLGCLIAEIELLGLAKEKGRVSISRVVPELTVDVDACVARLMDAAGIVREQIDERHIDFHVEQLWIDEPEV